MKGRILSFMLASAVICGALASCTVETYNGTSSRSAQQFNIDITPVTDPPQGQDSAGTKAPDAPTTAQPTVKPPESKAPEITAPPTAAQPQNNGVSPEYISAARTIMANLNDIDMIDGGAVSTSGETMDDGMYRYSKVTDGRFGSLWDVQSYVESRICGDLLYRYNEIYTGDVPMFKEFDGGLYYLQGGRGCGFNYKGDPQVSDITGGSFTFTIGVDYFGAQQTFVIDAVNDGGVWKACSLDRQ